MTIPKKRGRGRPAISDVVTRELILDTAYELTKTMSLEQISIAQIARHLGVVTGALHYHIGTKDDLNSAVLNNFYKNLYIELAASNSSGNWRDDITHLAETIFNFQQHRMGIARYMLSHARYGVFQNMPKGAINYGAALLDLIFQIFQRAGFSSKHTALYYHLIALHCLVSTNTDAARLDPKTYKKFLDEKAAQFSGDRYPGLSHALQEFAMIQTDEAFSAGLDAILDKLAADKKE